MKPGCTLCQGLITTDGHKRIPCRFCGFLFPRQAPFEANRPHIRAAMWFPHMPRRFKGST